MEDINKNLKDISLSGTKEQKIEFCEAWPKVKSGLELLLGLVKDPIAKGAILLTIKAGDAISSIICI
ncbi:hypothetical protein BH10BAC5_BH10BAC5_20110 [soil metagenome]